MMVQLKVKKQAVKKSKTFLRQVIKLPTSHGLNCHGRDSYEIKIRNLSAITVTLDFFIF